MQIKDTFKYRGVWMGLAILIVIQAHLPYNNFLGSESAWAAFDYLHNQVLWSVDIFFFASGLGCWFSLKKDPDAGRFMGRRMAKILPTFLPFLALWTAYLYVRDGSINIFTLIGEIFGVTNFSSAGAGFNWYITAMWVTYLLAPYLFALVEKCDRWYHYAGLIAASLVFTLAFWDVKWLIITVTRIPIFLIGMMAARLSDHRLGIRDCALLMAINLTAAAVMVYQTRTLSDSVLWLCGLYWYPCTFLVPGMCLAVSAIASLLDKTKAGAALLRPLNFLGGYTFEIYLSHLMIIDIYKWLISRGVLTQRNLYLIIVLAATAVLTALLRFVSRRISRAFSHTL